MTFKKTAIYISLSVMLICSTLIWYGYSLIGRVSNIESLWLGYNQHATAASYALNRISSNFGYGGFIHNYKNYILHQDAELVSVIENDLLATLEAVEDYLELDITEEEKKALRRLQHHIDIYAAKFDFARSLVGRGLSPREVEINVQVNDAPAFEAIEYLSKYALSRGKSAETETDASLSKTLRFLQWGALSIPFIIFVGLLVVFFVKRIVQANSRLSDAQKYADDLIEFAPNAWLIVNGSGQIIRANSQSSAMFGYSREEFAGMPIEAIIPERYQQHHVALRDSFIDKPAFKSLEERGAELIAMDKGGKEFPVEINLGYTYKEGAINVVSAIRDISARRKVEERQRLAEKIFENATDAILILDTHMHILDMNKAFIDISDIRKQDYIGQHTSEFSKTCFGGKIFQDVTTGLTKEGRFRGEWRMRDREGRDCVFLLSAGGVKSEQGKLESYFLVLSDITVQKNHEKQLEELANYDSLTGLPNRRLLIDRMANAIARASRRKSFIAVCYLDLDGFKAVNDELGHDAGDRVLKQVSELLGGCVREEDTVSRLGGDEFVVLFNDLIELENIKMLADRILSKLVVAVPHQSGELSVTTSMGISIFPRDGSNLDDLLACADKAMYQAKKGGKHNYVIYS